jgi:hypothetical protein
VQVENLCLLAGLVLYRRANSNDTKKSGIFCKHSCFIASALLEPLQSQLAALKGPDGEKEDCVSGDQALNLAHSNLNHRGHRGQLDILQTVLAFFFFKF